MIKWFFKWAFRLALLIVALCVVLLLSKDAIVKGLIEHEVRARTGLDARLDRVSAGVFSPVLHLDGLKIYNSAEFGGTLLLDAPEIHVEYDRRALSERRLRLRLVRLRISELNVVRNDAGRTNLLHLDWKNPSRALHQARDLPFPEIEVLNLSLGRVRLLDLEHPRRNREFRANLENQIFRNIKSPDDLRGLLFLLWLRSGGEAAAKDAGPKSAP